MKPLSLEAARKQWQSESPVSIPDAAIAPRPRAGRASFVCRVVNLRSAVMPDAEVKLVGPETRAVRTGRDGLVFVENLTPGSYQVTIGRRRKASDPVIETTIQLAADIVSPMVTLGEQGAAAATPVQEQPCCMPYGAPPARRRFV